MLIIGLDPSLSCTGWGVIAKSGNRLSHIANGQVKTDPAQSLPERLVTLDRELTDVIMHYRPDAGAVEEVFVNKNPQSTLKLGQARGVCLLALARAGLPISEYATAGQEGDRRHRRRGKGSGSGHAESAAAGVRLAGADVLPTRLPWRLPTRIWRVACASRSRLGPACNPGCSASPR